MMPQRAMRSNPEDLRQPAILRYASRAGVSGVSSPVL
jgi:hypothetical protein